MKTVHEDKLAERIGVAGTTISKWAGKHEHPEGGTFKDRRERLLYEYGDAALLFKIVLSGRTGRLKERSKVKMQEFIDKYLPDGYEFAPPKPSEADTEEANPNAAPPSANDGGAIPQTFERGDPVEIRKWNDPWDRKEGKVHKVDQLGCTIIVYVEGFGSQYGYYKNEYLKKLPSDIIMKAEGNHTATGEAHATEAEDPSQGDLFDDPPPAALSASELENEVKKLNKTIKGLEQNLELTSDTNKRLRERLKRIEETHKDTSLTTVDQVDAWIAQMRNQAVLIFGDEGGSKSVYYLIHERLKQLKKTNDDLDAHFDSTEDRLRMHVLEAILKAVLMANGVDADVIGDFIYGAIKVSHFIQPDS